MSDTTDKKPYEEVGQNYRFFLAWRHAAFAGGLVIVWGACSLLTSACEKGLTVACLIPFVAALALILLWLADCRTQQIYRSLVESGKALEGDDPGPYHGLSHVTIPTDAKLLSTKNERICRLYSHTFALKWFFVGSAIVLFGGGLYLLRYPPSLPSLTPVKVEPVAVVAPITAASDSSSPDRTGWATVALAVVTSVLAYLAIWGDWIKERVYRPKLKISLFSEVGHDIQRAGLRYFHLKIGSMKGPPAVNCRVMLYAFEKCGENGSRELVDMPFPVQLTWAPKEDPVHFRTISRSKTETCDLGFTAGRASGLESPVFIAQAYYMTPSYSETLLRVGRREKGRYHVRVEADNNLVCEPLVVEVSWDGDSCQCREVSDSAQANSPQKESDGPHVGEVPRSESKPSDG